MSRFDEPEDDIRTCPDCDGTGYIYHLEDKYLSKGQYHRALKLGLNAYKMKCKTCKGEGQVEYTEFDFCEFEHEF